MSLKRTLTSGVVAILLAASFVGVGASAANAAGSCSSMSTFGGGLSASSVVATCKGRVVFNWRCSSDLFFTRNAKTINYGTTFNTRSFVGCKNGYVVDLEGHSA